MTDLTPKAERTRHIILTTALDLFTQQGYDKTTMREIAGAASVSLGLAYRYFASKEALVLALYQQMAAETDEAIAQLPSGTVAQRFVQTMSARLEQAALYRETFGALFGAILTPRSGVELFGAEAGTMRQRAQEAFITLVQASTDAPRHAHAEDIGKLLYGAHFAVLLFWLRDPSPEQRATAALLRFIEDTLPWLMRGLMLPVVTAQLKRFVAIMDGAFGGTP